MSEERRRASGEEGARKTTGSERPAQNALFALNDRVETRYATGSNERRSFRSERPSRRAKCKYSYERVAARGSSARVANGVLRTNGAFSRPFYRSRVARSESARFLQAHHGSRISHFDGATNANQRMQDLDEDAASRQRIKELLFASPDAMLAEDEDRNLKMAMEMIQVIEPSLSSRNEANELVAVESGEMDAGITLKASTTKVHASVQEIAAFLHDFDSRMCASEASTWSDANRAMSDSKRPLPLGHTTPREQHTMPPTASPLVRTCVRPLFTPPPPLVHMCVAFSFTCPFVRAAFPPCPHMCVAISFTCARLVPLPSI